MIANQGWAIPCFMCFRYPGDTFSRLMLEHLTQLKHLRTMLVSLKRPQTTLVGSRPVSCSMSLEVPSRYSHLNLEYLRTMLVGWAGPSKPTSFLGLETKIDRY